MFEKLLTLSDLFRERGVANQTFAHCPRSFLLPNDLQLELEYWAESGEYSSEELQQVT